MTCRCPDWVLREVLTRIQNESGLTTPELAAVRRMSGTSEPEAWEALHARIGRQARKKLTETRQVRLFGARGEAGAYRELVDWLWSDQRLLVEWCQSILKLFG